MSTRNSAGGPVGEAPAPNKLADKMELGPDGHVEPVTEAITYKVVDSPGFVKELSGTWADCILNIDKPEFRDRLLKVRQQMNDVELLALGHGDTRVDLGRPRNEERLGAGVDSLLDAETYLKKEVMGMVRDVPFTELRQARGYYTFLLSLQKANDRFGTGLEVLRTHAGQYLSGWARRVHGRVSGSLVQHQGLGRMLSPLTDFVVGPAVEGAQTRKDNAVLAAKVEKETLDRVQPPAAPLAASPSAEPPPVPPARPKGRV
jgi:hypothetical protein